MIAVMDLSQSIEARTRQSVDALKSRIGQLLNVEPDQIGFGQKRDEALGKVLRLDILTAGSVTLPVQIGLPELGFFIQVQNKPNSLTTDGFHPSLMQSRAALDQLTPAALSEIDQVSSERFNLLFSVGQFILDRTDIESRTSSEAYSAIHR